MTPFLIALLVFTNADRATPLTPDPALMQRAEVRAEYLCAHNQWSHAGWLDSFKGYSGWVGENLAKDFPDATTTNAALMASPTHHANIVSTHYHRIGVAQDCDITVELFAQ